MADTGSGRPSLPRPVKLVLVLLLALGAAWLSLSTYLPRAMPQTFGAMRGVNTVYSEAGSAFLTNKGTLPDEQYQRLAGAARSEPLDAQPFLFFGLRALAAREVPAAERLLGEARARNPRLEMVRVALMALYLRTGRVAQGSAELATLVRILPTAAQLLVPELAAIAAEPRSRAAVAEAIGDQPIMAEVLNVLVQQDADPDVILSLAARQPRSAGTFAPWQQSLVTKLVQRGEISRAFELWKRFLGAEQNALVYDPEFKGLPGPPPFNWELTASGEVGAAERGRGGGLEMDYFGRRPGTLANQLLLLRPGRYRIEFPVEGSASGRGSRIVLRVACRAGNGAPLLNMPLEDLSFSPKTISAEFVVPRGCDSQWLGFIGQPAEFPNAQRARIPSISLRPAGG